MTTTYRPEPNTPDTLTVSALSDRQMARVEALKAARVVLASRNLAGSGAVDALDLVNVAMWIETGVDPWWKGAEAE
jgi:hypothetical protein